MACTPVNSELKPFHVSCALRFLVAFRYWGPRAVCWSVVTGGSASGGFVAPLPGRDGAIAWFRGFVQLRCLDPFGHACDLIAGVPTHQNSLRKWLLEYFGNVLAFKHGCALTLLPFSVAEIHIGEVQVPRMGVERGASFDQ